MAVYSGPSPVQAADAAQANLVTSTNTVTTLVTYSPPSNTCGRLVIDVVGKDNSQNTVAGEYSINFKNVSGTCSLVGTLTKVGEMMDSAVNTSAVTAAVSGGTVLLQVAGPTSVGMSWMAFTYAFIN